MSDFKPQAEKRARELIEFAVKGLASATATDETDASEVRNAMVLLGKALVHLSEPIQLQRATDEILSWKRAMLPTPPTRRFRSGSALRAPRRDTAEGWCRFRWRYSRS